MKTTEEIEKQLKAPFPEEDLEWRVQRSGLGKKGPWAMVLTYITARAIMERLDSVMGINNWKVEYLPSGNGFLCNLSLRINDEWITKQDGADATEVEAFKGGISSALKRAAVPWGIGQYLYKLESNFAIVLAEKKFGCRTDRVKNNDGSFTEFYWTPPQLPKWALPTPASVNETVKNASEANKQRIIDSLKGSDGEVKEAAGEKLEKASPVNFFSKEEISKELEAAKDFDSLAQAWEKHNEAICALPEKEMLEVKKIKDKRKKAFIESIAGNLVKPITN